MKHLKKKIAKRRGFQYENLITFKKKDCKEKKGLIILDDKLKNKNIQHCHNSSTTQKKNRGKRQTPMHLTHIYTTVFTFNIYNSFSLLKLGLNAYENKLQILQKDFRLYHRHIVTRL
jgi:hypothetical protein